MKLIISLAFIVLIICSIEKSAATPQLRVRRAVGYGYCPEGLTDEQCYENEVKKPKRGCVRTMVERGIIEWHTCGAVLCGEGLELTSEDLSKPYPGCCKTCR